ncbi:hypothetical protein EBI00_13880 [Marinomonas hwangdonensis]|uniref:Uncharacterized protein n=1 Tax=Marinomonas hwangdonensis TaxID=1053647 RepID=A0A3M8PZ45_9GAMM|nr:oligosaccharide flippase family protein [Marinomonas hwangdonensis]RNF48802.1 hypothetical protein EBI00_13880 [Marinomonas hwangdonensis]
MIKQFFKDSFFYTLSNLFTKGIAFIMLPIYLSYLDKGEYGIFDYISSVGSIFSVVVTLEIAQSVIRFAAEEVNLVEKSKIISNGFFFTLCTYIVFCTVLHLNLEEASVVLTDSPNNKNIASLAAISYMTSGLLYLSVVIYRANLNVGAAVISAAASAAISAIVSFVLLSYYGMGINGILIGLITGQSIVSVVNYFNLRIFLICKPEMNVLKSMIVFSAPLVFSSLGVMLAMFSDRFMIKEMLGFDALGEYGVAAKFAAVVTLLTVGFQSALAPLVYNRFNDPDTPKNLNKLFFYFFLIGFVFIIFSFILSETIITLIAGDGYNKAISILPLLVTSVLLSNGYLFFPGLSIAKKTHILAFLNIFTGVLNLVLNLFLIPIFDVYGAALATMLSALIGFILNVFYSERYYPILIAKSVLK